MFHVMAYRGTVADVANTAIAFLQDDVISRNPSTNTAMLPEDMYVYAAAAMSATINRARINCPTFRLITLPQIRPVITGAAPTDFSVMQLYLDQPLRIPANEEISIEGTSDVGAGGETMTSVLFVGPSLEPLPPGDIWTMRATSTTAATSGAWSTIAYTLSDNLPPGEYALVGSEHISTNAIAHRWIVPNQFYRPGNLSNTALSRRSNWQFTNRQMGTYGRFLNTVLPQCQVLCGGADATHTLFLQLVRVR